MWRWFFFLILMVVGPNAFSQAGGKHEDAVIIVVDASSTMSGKMGDETKIDSVKSVLRGLLAELTKEKVVGVMAYGHRRGQDCEDIETLVSIKKPTEGDLLSSLDRIIPKGRTPLTEAVGQATQMLEGQTTDTSVVLITDGPDTCGGDPCLLGRDLSKSGSMSRVHIIGLDLVAHNTSRLQCLALETGGTYTPVSNRTELQTALGHVVKSSQRTTTPRPALISPPSILTSPAPIPEN